ncbi:hypothetical protein CONPUDRAFT_96258 [Coniophora puteana RWD-64-598 SS2]|uniref:CBF1-interacting co-repressor CIR N-terminal domain-containing protein n=1 Tax=Coniophora puteana (strain RWD-64-598) TaxID=741705 RepID=A0A5M3N890_CONPW|nr:uncharacterized protein CONPUDRAFT_96258 [Coniophora puteana RWD-64-598 SS2]EIW87055.1 hypothetical protein CONPUDRAFT_96258 [Coniophora puteana RWD-64-598 SS2]
MGGGDLNMKKSWHPLLLKNQERVWLEEKKALEEKKKLDQLRKEKEEERQLQELQRLQEEQTGKKRTEKLEWMYSTPATGSSQNANDLEDYLLGKKRVDKILTADDNAKLGASHKEFIAVQNANTARDIASKIREDPLLAIKQQEQAAYQALMSNPLRLREMQQRNGVKPKKDKKEKKKEKKEKKERARLEEHGRSRSYSRSQSPRRHSPSYDRYNRSRRSPSYDRNGRSRRSPSHDRYDRSRRSRSPIRPSCDSRRDEDRYASKRKRSPTPDARSHPRGDPPSREPGRVDTWPRSDESDGSNDRRRYDGRMAPVEDRRQRSRSPTSKRTRRSPSAPPSSRPSKPSQNSANGTTDRAARLAAMQSNASTHEQDRQKRLISLLEKEKAELAEEERLRAKSKGMGGFLSHEQKRVFGGEGGLEDRIRRGRGGMVIDAD